MLAINPPTRQEMEQANNVIHRLAKVNKASTDRLIKKIGCEIQKNEALAAECEQVSKDLYKQILKALPDERSKELFSFYSLLISGQHTLNHAAHSIPETYGVFARALKKVKKHLGKPQTK